MAKHTIVSIHQVDSAGITGVRVGKGSLVAPRLVLVHPPLSDAIASTHGPTRLRAGIRSDTDNGPLVEVIDGWEQPRVFGKNKSGSPLVGLELRSAATSQIDVMDGMSEAQTMDELVELAVPVMETDSPTAWNGTSSMARTANVFDLLGLCFWCSD